MARGQRETTSNVYHIKSAATSVESSLEIGRRGRATIDQLCLASSSCPLKRRIKMKANSYNLAPNKRRSLSVVEIHPDDLAAQLTLIDLPIFKAITRDELTKSLTTNNLKQRHNAHPNVQFPNVQSLKRQFNQLTFWVAGQILALNLPRQRAELVSHLIKTAKRLYQLNNLHSSNAIVSALFSSPIHRLHKTWHHLGRKYPKEKVQFEKLLQLFSDTNNYEALRKHLNECDLPCIPYLGLYSRDIIYIQQANHEHEPQRTSGTNKILDLIEKFQGSKYDNLVPMPDVRHLLESSRYLDELQKFIEDANYRRSLEIEPPAEQQHNSSYYKTNYHNQNTGQIQEPKHCSNSNTLERTSSPDSLQATGNGATKLVQLQQGRTTPQQHPPKRLNVLSGLTSMVHSAVASTSNRFGAISLSPSKANNVQANDLPRCAKYLIDDSFICHGNTASNCDDITTNETNCEVGDYNNNMAANFNLYLIDNQNTGPSKCNTLEQSYCFQYPLRADQSADL